MGNPSAFEKHKELIAILKRDYELRRLRDYSPEMQLQLTSELKGFVETLLADLGVNQNKVLPCWTFTPLFINATNLLIYRECLATAEENQGEYCDNYVDFLNRNPIFRDAIQRKNPFVMHEHLLHLGNIIQRYQDMKSFRIAPNDNILHNIKAYRKMLKLLHAQIEALDSKRVGPFKDYLLTLANYTRYIASGGKNANLYLKEAFVCAKTAQFRLNKLEKRALEEAVPLTDFYTLGRGLFARTPLASFEAVAKHISNLGVLNAAELTQLHDQALSRAAADIPKEKRVSIR